MNMHHQTTTTFSFTTLGVAGVFLENRFRIGPFGRVFLIE